MKKSRLPLWTFAGIGTIVLIFSFITFKYIYETAREELVQAQLQSGQRESREIGKLLEQQLNSGLPPKQVIHNLQLSILNTDMQTEFICMYDTNGIELCHPNPAMIGQVIDDQNSVVKTGQNQQSTTFQQWLQEGKGQSGVRSFPDNKRPSEIVSVYPVDKTGWIVALHVNIPVLTSKLSNLYLQFFLAYLVSAILLVACCYALVRLIYRKYEHKVEAEKDSLNKEIESLAVLNRQLNVSQERLRRELLTLPTSTNPDVPPKAAKQRIITYHRNELIKLNTDDIAFIFLKNGVTCLHTFDGTAYTTNDSLDEIMKNLENINFYRANRQVIVNIRAIKTIQLYGNNQLKLITDPGIDTELLISKNKVADFKQWLNQ